MGKGKNTSRGNANNISPPEDKQKEEVQNTSDNRLQFSVFLRGYINKEGKAVPQVRPYKVTTLERVKEYIENPVYAGKATETLRTITDHDENSRFKVLNFCMATFSGIFSYRNGKGLQEHSGLTVLDFDEEDIRKKYPKGDIKKILKKLRKMFKADRVLSSVMIFISPNGNGLKVIIYVGSMQGLSHKECFAAISEYILQKYEIKPDASGSNVDRACFLPYDRECYLNLNFSKWHEPAINLHFALEEKRKREQAEYHAVMKSFSGKAHDVYELVERWVSRDTAYIEGSYNRYVMKCGYLLCNFGVPEPEAEEWAVARFNDYESRQVRSIIQSCYRNGEFGTKTFKKQ